MLYVEVIIDMENSNALTSVAYISQSNGNPYHVFCEYIKYCLTMHSSDQMAVGNLRIALYNEFGTFFPRNVLERCIRLLVQEGFCSTEKFLINRKGSFDCNLFNQKRDEFCKAKDNVVKHLIEHASMFGKEWDESEAEKALNDFLQTNGTAFELFFQRHEWHPAERPPEQSSIQVQESTASGGSESEGRHFSNQWYVGNFIQHELETNGPCKSYLQDISNGIMICIGTYHLADDDDDSSDLHIDNTNFFFDTKLLLRLIGCAWEEAVESVKELVKFIQEGGGRIYYFPHTLTEVNNALERAERCARNGSTHPDKEMAYFLHNVNITPATIRVKRLNVREELKQSGIFQRELTEWSESDRLSFGLDQNDMFSHIRNHEPNWDNNSIMNDVASIREVHMLRGGNYQDYYGTVARLPVFVTSNTRLLSLLLMYAKDRGDEKRIRGWKPNRLPAVTDIRLTCRLWNPAHDAENIPLLQLAGSAVAAQQPDSAYFDQLRRTINILTKILPAYAKVPLSEYCDDEFTERVVMQIKGDIDKLDVSVLQNTVNEYAQTKLAEEQEKRQDAERKYGDLKQKIDEQTQQIVRCCVEKHKNKLGLWGVLLLCIWHWTEVATIVFGLVMSTVSLASQQWYPMLAVIVPALLFVFEKFLNRSRIRDLILSKIVPIVKNAYKEKIRGKMNSLEHQYEKEILEQCIAETKYLNNIEKD